MASRRQILDTLTRQHLLDLAATADISRLTGKAKTDIVDALVASRSLKLEAVLATLSRDQLKAVCRDIGLDDSGKEKQVLIARLLGTEAGPGTADSGRQATRSLPINDYRHETEKRVNIPPAQMAAEGTVPAVPKVKYAYSPRRTPVLRFDPNGEADELFELLDQARRRPLTADEVRQLSEALRTHEPWLEWAGKQEADQRGFFDVDPVALHIHERVSAQAILKIAARQDVERNLFGDPEMAYHEAVQFYRHDVDWTNRLILGDSLQVMSSLAHRENLAGKVQMIYIDPPYGIKFASNFQPEVGRSTVKDRETDLTREPDQVKAYRDTWYLGIHSYLTYLRQRLLAARDLLSDSGSVFVQMNDDNLHRVTQLLDQVFGIDNRCQIISFAKTTSTATQLLSQEFDYLLWYAKDRSRVKYRQLFHEKRLGTLKSYRWLEDDKGLDYRPLTDAEKPGSLPLPESAKVFQISNIASQDPGPPEQRIYWFEGNEYDCGASKHWKTTNPTGLDRLANAGRLIGLASQLNFKRYLEDHPAIAVNNLWDDTGSAGFSGADPKVYVVQTDSKVVARCLLMTTDPGDLVLDPTVGSGTTAYVAEQWGRRWIGIDTSRVAVAIARQRLMTAKFDYYKLKDQQAGPGGGFHYNTVPHITLKSIAQNQNLDPIFATHEPILNEKLDACNRALAKVSDDVRRLLAGKLLDRQKAEGKRSISGADRRRWELPKRGGKWQRWEVPFDVDADWPIALQEAVTEYREAWRAKMNEVSACVAANAEQEELVDQPEIMRNILRVSGPFTVEAVQPPEESLGHIEPRQDDEVTAGFDGAPPELPDRFSLSDQDLAIQNVQAYLSQMIRYLRVDGVRFPDNRQMRFTRLEPLTDATGLHAEGRWVLEGDKDADPEGRANIAAAFGPQYGPVTALQVEEVIRAANRRGYDALVVAGFSFDGEAQTIIEQPSHPHLRVHMTHIRPDVNPAMAGLLKEQPGSQLFTVFGQPRSHIDKVADGTYTVTMEGVDIYDPLTNTISSSGATKVAAWFLDGDYDNRTFCITQAFFPNRDAWNKLARALSAQNVIDPSVFEALSGTTSLPFPAGKYKRAAIKVIDPRGNEVMQVHRLE